MYELIDNNVNYLVENLLNQLIVMICIINILWFINWACFITYYNYYGHN